jgi:hypothetical protein
MNSFDRASEASSALPDFERELCNCPVDPVALLGATGSFEAACRSCAHGRDESNGSVPNDKQLHTTLAISACFFDFAQSSAVLPSASARKSFQARARDCIK